MAANGQFYDYHDGDATFEAYVTGAGQEPRPTVVLAHEWSGLNQSIRRNADRMAELGYVCFAIDVYGKGKRGDEQGDNHYLMDPLLENRALLRRRLLAGFQAALGHPAVDPSRVAALGYCFGGLCVLDLARANPAGLKGVVSVHGVLKPPNIDGPQKIDASILVLHGWEDPVAPPADVLALASELTNAGADWQLHAYGHAMHAFTAEGLSFPDRGFAYNEKAASRAWVTLCGFFGRLLRS